MATLIGSFLDARPPGTGPTIAYVVKDLPCRCARLGNLILIGTIFAGVLCWRRFCLKLVSLFFFALARALALG